MDEMKRFFVFDPLRKMVVYEQKDTKPFSGRSVFSKASAS